MKGKDLIAISDLSRQELDLIFDTAKKLKKKIISAEKQREICLGKTLAMIFEKPSLRTRVTFEVGMTQLGGHAVYLAPSDIQLGKRESVKDVAANLSRWVDIIMARTFSHSTVVELANGASVPVINGLSDLAHPCQALADMLTIMEHKPNQKVKIAFIGDGNNVAHSLMVISAKMGMDFVIACPEGYEPQAEMVSAAQKYAEESGGSVGILRDPYEAVEDADVIYTDVWASMGQEAEAEMRAKVFASYQVNAKLMSRAKTDAIFEHCLPAHRGWEVTDEVIDGPHSVVLDEAENRLHVQKAVIALAIGDLDE